ncbi:hypothetical protein NUW54_g12114 [Trametes sanguinea]|uniref:Uncharacterized protein n=1 Tax=Trametes sanguinea TaxID=158606 RepID=A0ACC1N263_9APHY|nr:hypothetical protein NUW54_g12114 [Trametes sanguinea]
MPHVAVAPRILFSLPRPRPPQYIKADPSSLHPRSLFPVLPHVSHTAVAAVGPHTTLHEALQGHELRM